MPDNNFFVPAQPIGKVCIVHKGTYEDATSYEKLDVVNYRGSSYICISSSSDSISGISPMDSNNWKIMAQGGVGAPNVDENNIYEFLEAGTLPLVSTVAGISAESSNKDISIKKLRAKLWDGTSSTNSSLKTLVETMISSSISAVVSSTDENLITIINNESSSIGSNLVPSSQIGAARVSSDYDSNSFLARLVDFFYPIGSIFMTGDSYATEPSRLFPGTCWQEITDQFLFAGSTFAGTSVAFSSSDFNCEAPIWNNYIVTNSPKISFTVDFDNGQANIGMEDTSVRYPAGTGQDILDKYRLGLNIEPKGYNYYFTPTLDTSGPSPTWAQNDKTNMMVILPDGYLVPAGTGVIPTTDVPGAPASINGEFTYAINSNPNDVKLRWFAGSFNLEDPNAFVNIGTVVSENSQDYTARRNQGIGSDPWKKFLATRLQGTQEISVPFYGVRAWIRVLQISAS